MSLGAWILTIILTFVYLVLGLTKLLMPRSAFRERMADAGTWSDYVDDKFFKVIGLVEVLGALGLILPAVTGIAEPLTNIAAVGLAIVMFLGLFLHIKIKDKGSKLIMPIIFIAMAVTLAFIA